MVGALLVDVSPMARLSASNPDKLRDILVGDQENLLADFLIHSRNFYVKRTLMKNEALQGTVVDGGGLHDAVKLGNPYRYYDLLRSKEPIHWDAHLGGWFCTRYSDVIACLRDRRLSAEQLVSSWTDEPQSAGKVHKGLYGALRLWMVFKAPPQHSHLHNICGKGFTQTAVDSLCLQIDTIVN